MKPDEKRLDYLLSGLLDKNLSNDEKEELEEILLNNKSARAIYRDAMSLHCALSELETKNHSESEEMILVPAEIAWKSIEPQKNKILKFASWGAIAASILLALFLFDNKEFFLPNETQSNLDSQENLPETGFIASIYDIKGEVSMEGYESQWLHPGNDIGINILNIKEGTISLLFGVGVDVTIEGPAKFEILDEMNARLHFGKLIADVPDVGHGFTIHTHDYSVEDLGTKFGMSVGKNGSSEVQVLDGQVAFIQGENRTLLNTGEGMSSIEGQLKKLTKNMEYQILQELNPVTHKLPGVASGPFGNIETGKLTESSELRYRISDFKNDQKGFLLEEAFKHTLEENLPVDHNGSSALFSGGNLMDAGTIPAGKTVNSYLFRTELFSKTGTLVTVFTVQFTSKIIGLQATNNTLSSGYAALSPTNKNNLGSQMRFYKSHDRAYIWPDQKTITIRSGIGTLGSDTLRIITEFI